MIEATKATYRATVQSVERSAAVLNELLSAGRSLSALEISRGVGLHRTIVHRLLRTMAALDLVSEPTPGRYQLGPATLLLGQGYLDRLPIRRLALPYLVELSNRVVVDEPWIVALAVPARPYAILVERLWQAGAPLDTVLALGTRLPLTESAHGRAMLSTYPDDEIRALVGDQEADRLAGRIEEIRARDHLDFADSEHIPGLAAVAAAVRKPAGGAVGSVAVSGLKLEAELFPGSPVATHVLRAARSISSALLTDL